MPLFTQKEGGHEVLFLQKDVWDFDPSFVDDLWGISARADIWGSSANRSSRLALRVLEIIDYYGGSNEGRPHSLGYHIDGATMLTIAVMLSSASDFEGGGFEIQHGSSEETLCTESVEADLGDLVGWRGWWLHRVAPITSGHRRVLVPSRDQNKVSRTQFLGGIHLQLPRQNY